jgi:LCP family protein required for cell wall assembly
MVLLGIGGILGLLVIGFIFNSVLTYTKILEKNSTKSAPILNFFGDVKPNQLQGEGDGRINVLLIGIGGAKHPGGTLADTIMVASLDPKNKEVALLSIPRDMYVPIGDGTWNKINAAHSNGERDKKNSGGGPAVLKKTVSTVLDLPIHYFVRVDFSALEKIVDTLGGITVNVENPIVDLTFPADNMIDYSPFRLSAGTQTLNGKTALKYARSRHGAGGEGSDFARAKRQQKVITAIKDKAMSANVLTSPKKINELIAVLGDHVKTDISAGEVERFISLWKDVDSSKVISKVLDDSPDGPLMSHSGDARGYILLPKAGDFSEVQEIAHSIFTDPFLRDEKAKLSFINASGSTTIGKKVLTQLQSYGYQVTDNTSKTQEKSDKTTLVDKTDSKPYTRQFLETRFKIKTTKQKEQNATVDMVLTIGTDYKLPSPNSQLGTGSAKTTPSPKTSAKASNVPSEN